MLRFIAVCLLFTSGFSQRVAPCPAGYNAPYRIKSCFDLFSRVHFLYYQALEEGLDIGCEQKTEGNSTHSTIKGMDFSFDPGFKVGIGKYFNHDDWQVYLEYMRFHQSTSRSFSGEDIIPYWANPNTLYDQAKAKWRLKVDILDLELAREYFVGRCLTFRTHIGLRGAYIRQNYDAEYESIDALAISDNKLSSWGIGPMMGFDMKWFFCNRFHLFGDFVWGILYTEYSSFSQKITESDSNTSEGTQVTCLKNCDPCFLRPEVEATMGIAWGRPFCSCRYYVDFKLGYNFHVFWNQNIFYRISDTFRPTGSQDLYLHGLSLSMGLHF